MSITSRKWTIWEVNPLDKDDKYYRLRINSIGGPAGNTGTIRIGRKRMLLLLDFYNVQDVSDLKTKTFESIEVYASAALFDFLLKILQFD